MNFQKEGTFYFTLKTPDSDWATNNKEYDFGSIGGGGIGIVARKLPDYQLELTIDGPLNKQFVALAPIPQINDKGLRVHITWKKRHLNVYFNGKIVYSERV